MTEREARAMGRMEPDVDMDDMAMEMDMDSAAGVEAAEDGDILRLVRDEDVKFIRLAFTDLGGIPKNMAIMSSELRRALREGIAFDASAVSGLTPIECSDLFLVPDCSTISILPWRPAHERVMRIACDVHNPDGSEFEAYSRSVLKKAVARAVEMGYIVNIGTECEFFLFQVGENGEPTLRPLDRGSYADVAPLDKGENIRREICLALEEMGLEPECSHHESGPGQNEIDFRYSDALSAADHFMVFKMAVKAISAVNGAYASFMPKPLEGESGNGLHINISLMRGGRNVFRAGGEHSEDGESFIAGILARIREITAFLNPTPNSYERLGAFQAPKYVTWSHQNRSQLIRIPAASPEHVRMELRSADPGCNPYLAFAMVIHAGLDGIEQGMKLCPPCNENALEIDDPSVEALPSSLGEALALARGSELVHRALPQRLLEEFFSLKEKELEEYAHTGVNERHNLEIKRYFRKL